MEVITIRAASTIPPTDPPSGPSEATPANRWPHGPLVERVQDGGALAGWQVGSVDEARAAAAAGCDLVVVRGTEGGERMYGGRSLWPLLSDVLDAVDVPVVASGGIANGRGLAAAIAAGAAACRMGTRFVATPESGAHPA